MPFLGELAALGAAASWALGLLPLKILSRRYGALTLATTRCLFGGLLIFLVALALGRVGQLSDAPPASVFLLILGTFLGVGLGLSIYTWAIATVETGRAYALTSIGYPIPALIIGALLLGEKVTGLHLLGILGVLGGTYLIALPRGNHPFDFSQLAGQRKGLALILVVILLWGIQVPLTKLGMEGMDILNANFLRLLGTVPFTAAMALHWERHLQPHRVSPRYLGLACLSAAVGYGSGGFLWLLSIQHIGSGLSSVLSSTSPLFMIPLAALLLKEKPSRRLLGGTGLAVLGISLVFLG